MNVTRSVLDNIKTKQLQWYGQVQRMEEGRLPKELMKWRPPGRRKRGRPKLTGAEGIRGLMGENGMVEEDWNDRHNCRKKNKWAQEYVNTLHNLLNNNIIL
jgi:hypothetical protein